MYAVRETATVRTPSNYIQNQDDEAYYSTARAGLPGLGLRGDVSGRGGCEEAEGEVHEGDVEEGVHVDDDVVVLSLDGKSNCGQEALVVGLEERGTVVAARDKEGELEGRFKLLGSTARLVGSPHWGVDFS